mmetsp:Transcript_38424/g.83598  ORF Transcript_38424/g.83598 Transcript_38424/m.83598 type:complete len:226 (+) Transcript_38424:2251-2928(+)
MLLTIHVHLRQDGAVHLPDKPAPVGLYPFAGLDDTALGVLVRKGADALVAHVRLLAQLGADLPELALGEGRRVLRVGLPVPQLLQLVVQPPQVHLQPVRLLRAVLRLRQSADLRLQIGDLRARLGHLRLALAGGVLQVLDLLLHRLDVVPHFEKIFIDRLPLVQELCFLQFDCLPRLVRFITLRHLVRERFSCNLQLLFFLLHLVFGSFGVYARILPLVFCDFKL